MRTCRAKSPTRPGCGAPARASDCRGRTIRAHIPRFDRREVGAIYAGGVIGALARVALGEMFATPPGAWPWPTFAINIAGALALGYFATRLLERLPPSAYPRPLLGTGLCGALTTFSVMQLELLRMLDAGSLGLAAAYGSASIAGGILAVHAATSAVRRSRISR